MFVARTSRFSEQQIAFALKQVETGTAVGEVIRNTSLSEAYADNPRCNADPDFQDRSEM